MKKIINVIKYRIYQIEVILSIIMVLFIGTTGYMVIEKWSFYESFYMTVITITTVGFGETKPLSDLGRIFTIFLIFIGLGTAATFATMLTKGLIDKELRSYFGTNKLRRQIEKMENHYIICGFGNIGRTIADTFKNHKIPFIVVELAEDACEIAQKSGYLYINGNATEDAILVNAGIKKSSGLITVLNHDSDNLFVSLAARELNQNIFIISRGSEANTEKRILRAGANMVVYPLKLGGEQIAHIVAQKYIGTNNFTFENCPSGIMGYSMKIYHHFENKSITIKEVIKKTNALQALFLRKSNGLEVDKPKNDLKINRDDNILVLVKE
ncbi:MAG: potassium channel family protein [Clostridiales bacterium]